MSDNFKKPDLRIIKTHKALVDAMSQLLELRNFNRITVHDLCETAQISRATFYAHFNDKYDLLRYWLSVTQVAMTGKTTCYREVEELVNTFVAEHSRSLRNLLDEANPETAELLRDFITSLITKPQEKSASGITEAQQAMLNKFCAGGIYNYLLWQVKNKFPADLPLLNNYLYNIIITLRRSNSEDSY